MGKLDVKRNMLHTKAMQNPYFVSHMSHLSSLGSIAGEMRDKEGRNEKT